MRLAIKSITTTIILAGLLVTASCVSAEQNTRSGEPVSKTLPQVKQPSKIRITVCGKEILSELESELEPLSKVGVVIEKDADVLVLTSDRMADELTELLEKARVLMGKHPGGIQVIQGNGEGSVQIALEMRNLHDGNFPQRAAELIAADFDDRLPVVSQHLRARGMGGGISGLRRMSGMPGGMGVMGGFGPFPFDHYAYAGEDRQHAAKLDRETHDLARQYVRTSDQAERDELASKLKVNLNELFDLKLKGYTAKMGAIERELETLRAKVEERKSNKELIVTGRFKELVGEDNPIRW